MQNAVPLGDASQAGVEVRAIERVRDDADQFFGGVARQAGVAIQGEAIPDARQDAQVADLDPEAGVGRAAQQPVELLDLAPLALPADPRTLPRVPPPRAMKQVEAIGPSITVAGVEGVDAGACGGENVPVLRHLLGGRVGKIAKDREVDTGIDVAERLNLQVVEQLVHARDTGEEGGHDDHRPRVLGDPRGTVEPGEPLWRHHPCRQPLHERDRELAGGEKQQRRRPRPCPCPGGLAQQAGVPRGPEEQQTRDDSDGSQVDLGGIEKDDAAKVLGQAGTVLHVGLELGPTLADQVVPDVSGSPGRSELGRLTGAFDGAERDAELGFAGRLGQILNRVPVTIAAQKIHAAVHPGRVALEHLLDEADLFDVIGPIQRRAQAEAGDGVGDGDLGRGLAGMVGADGFFSGRPVFAEARFHRGPERRHHRPVLADPLQQLDDVRRVESGGLRWQDRVVLGRIELSHIPIGLAASASAVEHITGQASEVLDEGQLEHAGPRPELADRQRGDRLVRDHEADQAVAIQPAVALPNELQRHRVDARRPGLLPRGQFRELEIIFPREGVEDATDLGFDEVEIVQQPLRRGRHDLAAVDVVGHDPVGLAQDPRVVFESGEEPAGAPAGIAGDCKTGGECLGALFEPLDVQDFAVQRLFGCGVPPAPEESEKPREAVTHRDGSKGLFPR